LIRIVIRVDVTILVNVIYIVRIINWLLIRWIKVFVGLFRLHKYSTVWLYI